MNKEKPVNDKDYVSQQQWKPKIISSKKSFTMFERSWTENFMPFCIPIPFPYIPIWGKPLTWALEGIP